MKQVVFVVGAGASVDFGMPIGAGLVEMIQHTIENELGADDGLILQSASRSAPRADYMAAARDVAGGMNVARSIDRFLQTRDDRPAVTAIGKRAIADVISKGEERSPLGRSTFRHWHDAQYAMNACRNSWISRLFALLQEGVRPEHANTVFEGCSFVTFNYDRIIQTYLELAFRHALNRSEAEAEHLTQNIPIIHVYGSLGPVSVSAPRAIPFGLTTDKFPHVLDEMAGNIRTFCEQHDDRVLAAIRDRIEEADLIVFLGFGFDELNVDALFRHPLRDDQQIAGTMMGLGNAARDLIENKIKREPFSFANMFPQPCADFINSEAFRAMLRE